MTTKAVQKAPAQDRPETFRIKGGLFPMTLLELRLPDLEAVKAELSDKVATAPAFFQNSAIVFGLDQLTDDDQARIDLEQLRNICRELHLVPTAVRGAVGALEQQSMTLGLAVLPKGKDKTPSEPKPVEVEQAPEPAESAVVADIQTTKTITTPVRSGQQIYAPGGDLIILTSVSAGAEVLADGNIHIYGALRGRALAGIKGDRNARIFCSSQEAELVSIAGQFMVDETLRTTLWKQSVQVHLAEDNISITALS